jgi:streptogramin lyase
MSKPVSRLLSSLAGVAAAILLSACGSPSQSASGALPLQAALPGGRDAVPVLRTYTAGVTPGFHRHSYALDITLGPDGAMWFTDLGNPAIGRITASGKVTEFSKGLMQPAKPYSIVAGPDGNLWFSDICGRIGRITPHGKIDEFSLRFPAGTVNPNGIVVGSDGAIWSNAQGPPNFLVRSDLNGHLKTYKIPPTYGDDGSLAVDGSGNLWMMSHHGQWAYMLEREPDGSFVRHHTGLSQAEVPCCPNYAPKRLTIGADGNPWYTTLYWLKAGGLGGNVIATTSDSGTTLFPVNRRAVPYSAYPSGITTMGGHVWFVGDDPFQVNGGLWRIDENGKQQGYSVPHNPVQVAPDGSGNLWFTAEGFDHPAQIVEVIAPK